MSTKHPSTPETPKSVKSKQFSILPSAADVSPSDEPQAKLVKKKKKKPKQKLS